MRIIKDKNQEVDTVIGYPDLFASEKKKDTDKYIKGTAEYFFGIARSTRNQNLKTFGRNYKFFKGQLDQEDFYENVDTTTSEFIAQLEEGIAKIGESLPKYVQNYTAMLQPVNTLIGETCKKPDNSFVKAYDEDSQSDQLAFFTDTLMQYGLAKELNKLKLKALEQGADIDSEEVIAQMQQMAEKEVEDKLSSYTSLAERWGNRMLENLKMEFNLKEVREELLSDLLKAGRLYAHVYEDNSSLGFGVEVLNPVDYGQLTLPNKKYSKDAYACWILEVMEISQITDKFKLNQSEVDALIDKKKSQEASVYELNNSYDRGIEEFRKIQEEQLFRNDLESQLGFITTRDTQFYGSKFAVLTCYYKDKVKIGKLQYFDEEGISQFTTVDESYKSGDHPYEIDLQWAYDTQIVKLTKIGDVLYDREIINFTNRLPITGGQFDPKNSDVQAYIDYMKPIQVLINVVGNQLWELLYKEKGVYTETDLRGIPVATDGELENAIQEHEDNIKNTGSTYKDNSPENRKAPGDNTTVTKVIDASRTNEIQSRIMLWKELKAEAWAIVGQNAGRLGGMSASTTATGVQAEQQASFNQTEPWLAFHEYVVNDMYQLLLDTAQYTACTNESSTVATISGEGSSAFIKVTPPDIHLKDLRVFVTSRSEDWEILNQGKRLSESMIQNGVSAYEIFKMTSSKNIRGIEDSLRKVKELQDQYQQQTQQTEQSKVEAIQNQTQTMAAIEQAKIENDNVNKEKDRRSRELVATITSTGKDSSSVDADNNGIPDIIDLMNAGLEGDKLNNEHQSRLATIAAQTQAELLKNTTNLSKIQLEKDKLKVQQAENEKDRLLKEKELQANIAISKRNKN